MNTVTVLKMISLFLSIWFGGVAIRNAFILKSVDVQIIAAAGCITCLVTLCWWI